MYTSALAETTTHTPYDNLEGYGSIGLNALNAKAAMLERRDNKYVISGEVLQELLHRLTTDFDVLEIGGRRSFTYDTCYFDGVGLPLYHAHHQGRRKRAKVRIRTYVESKLCFVEVKLKDKRGGTVKKRLPYDGRRFGVLDDQARAHVERCFTDFYQQEFPCDLQRVLDMRYQRTTLVAKRGGERLTIDSHLQFRANGAVRSMQSDRFVVETKSANGNGLADRVLRTLHQHPTNHCSKYCIGTAFLNRGLKQNKFLRALRLLQDHSTPLHA